MRITLTSAGRFHYFDMARELNRIGALERLFTGYPMWKVETDLRDKTSSFPWIVVPQMALYRYGFENIANWMSLPATNTLDRWVANHLPDCDLFLGLSQSCLFTLRTAKKRGIKAICERGSAHIVVQNQILMEEYRRNGIPFKGIAQWAIEKELQEYEEADRIKVLSQFAYNSFVAQGMPKDKLVNIPLGVNTEQFAPVPKEDQVFRILYVGTMSLQKGLPYLLEAVSQLKLDNVETWLVGAETEEIRSTFERYAGYFRYMGVIPRDQLKWYYSQASVFVLASVQDGFGSVLNQAMACGLPIIATTNTGANDIITEGVEGYIVPIRDPRAIREKIVHLYENPDVRQQMSEAALKRAQSFKGWREHAEQVVKLVQGIEGQRSYHREDNNFLSG